MAAPRSKSFPLTPFREGRPPRSAAEARKLVEQAPDNTAHPTVQSYPVQRKRAKADARAWDAQAAMMRTEVLQRAAKRGH